MKEEERMIIQLITKTEVLVGITIILTFVWFWLFYQITKQKQRLLCLLVVIMLIVSFVGMMTSFVLSLKLVNEGTSGTAENFIIVFLEISVTMFVIHLMFFLISVTQLKDYFSEE